jgi:hypothetical protein
MSNGAPATMRDARQQADMRAPGHPRTTAPKGARKYMMSSDRDGVAAARATAIEDARMDCRSTILRHAVR